LILRYTDDEYNDTYQSTIGVDFKIKNKLMQNNKVARMQLWDTGKFVHSNGFMENFGQPDRFVSNKLLD